MSTWALQKAASAGASYRPNIRPVGNSLPTHTMSDWQEVRTKVIWTFLSKDATHSSRLLVITSMRKGLYGGLGNTLDIILLPTYLNTILEPALTTKPKLKGLYIFLESAYHGTNQAYNHQTSHEYHFSCSRNLADLRRGTTVTDQPQILHKCLPYWPVQLTSSVHLTGSPNMFT